MKAHFCIVSREDIPIYETSLFSNAQSSTGSTSGGLKEDLIQFILHASLDNVQQKVWAVNSMFLKNIDKFNEDYISAFATAGHVKFLLLHDPRLDETVIRHFFENVYELYVKALLNPFYKDGDPIRMRGFNERVQELADKHLKFGSR